MFKHEIHKLLIKQKMLFPAVILLALDIVFMMFSYRDTSFANAVTERHYNEYLNEFSGKPNDEKSKKIIAEQERILDAQNAEEMLRLDLIDGKFESEQEYIEKRTELIKTTECADAFDAFFKLYEAAQLDPENRYILKNDYSGLTSDFPDIFLLGFVILASAVFFLNEESSHMITLIKIGENGKSKTFFSKITALFLTIFCVEAVRFLAELLLLAPHGNELSYPIQSIPFFCDCQYNITIINAFLIIHAMRLLGYLFIAALVLLLAVTIKKPLFTVFIPCVFCVLQQFLFVDPSSPAYYLPTGLLRAAGYFRGDDIEKLFPDTQYEIVTVHFKTIPKPVPILIAGLSVIFIAVSLMIAVNYYGRSRRKRITKTAAAVTTLSLCITLCGCSDKRCENIVYNTEELVQNDKFYFISEDDKVIMVNKSDGLEIPIIRDEMDDKKDYKIMLCGDYLYYAYIMFQDIEVKRISLLDFKTESVYSNITDNEYGFLGLKRKEYFPDDFFPGSFFADGKNVYYLAKDGIVYTYNGGTPKAVTSEPSYTRISFDGENIYYINMSLELISHNIESGEEEKLAGDFTRLVYYDGKRILYVNKNGLFEIPRGSSEARKISDITMENKYHFQSDGTNIIFCENDSIFVLDENGIPQKACDLPEHTLEYDLLKGTNKLIVNYMIKIDDDDIEFINEIIDLEGLKL